MSTAVQMNENTAAVQEPVVASGSGVTDFDELERLSAKPKAKEAKTKVEKSGKDTEPDPQQEKGKADKGDAKAKAEAKARKLYKAKIGEATAEYDPEADLEVTVDGKPMPVKLQELVNNYSGKTAWDKRFTELDRSQKSFQTEKARLTETLQKFHELSVVKGDPLTALTYVAEQFGANPVEIRQAYMKRLQDMATQMSGKSPEEIQAAIDQNELASLRQNEAQKLQDAEMGKIKAQLQTRIEKVTAEHGLDEASFVKAYHELKQYGVEDITPETVGQYVSEVKVRTEIKDALTSVNSELTEQKISDAIEDLRKAQLAQNLSIADVKDIITQVYGKGPSKVQRLAKRLDQPANRSSTVSPSREPQFFDDL
jgi:hypothetical protein